MADRLNLHASLVHILGSDNVYFQPPESLKMKYPCIRYSLSGTVSRHADNRIYSSTKRYEVTVIDSDPDSDIHEKILEQFQMCSFDRSYTADNLNHKTLTIYY